MNASVNPADQYRPKDAVECGIAIREMQRNGLKARDIAEVLQLGLGAVLQSLRDDGRRAGGEAIPLPARTTPPARLRSLPSQTR
jgi:hypothetical protein